MPANFSGLNGTQNLFGVDNRPVGHGAARTVDDVAVSGTAASRDTTATFPAKAILILYADRAECTACLYCPNGATHDRKASVYLCVLYD